MLFILISPLLSAGEVSLFPAFSAEKNEDTSTSELNVAYPLFHIRKDAKQTRLIIPLLFSMVNDAETGFRAMDILWPFNIYRRNPRSGQDGFRSWFYFLLLFQQSDKNTPDSGDYSKTTFFPFWYSGTDQNGKSHYIFFPFFYYADDAIMYLPFPSTEKQSYFGILPFYGIFRNLAGNDLIRTVMWPFFVHVHHDTKDKYFFPWPFLGYGKGDDYKAWRFWPLFSWSRWPDGSRKLNYLWPLGYHRNMVRENGGKATFDMFLPFFLRYRSPDEKWDAYSIFYAQRDTPHRHQSGILWPLFHSVKFKQNRGWGFTALLLIFRYQDAEHESIRQFFPFFIKKKKPDQTRIYAPWPLFQYRYDKFANHEKWRWYLFPFLMHKKEKRKDGTENVRNLLFPFFTSMRSSDGSFYTVAPHLFYNDGDESIIRNLDSILPLYRSFGDAEGNYSRRIFWKIYHREHKKDYDLSEINTLVFQWKKENDSTQYNILGGLFGLVKKSEETRLKLLFMTF